LKPFFARKTTQPSLQGSAAAIAHTSRFIDALEERLREVGGRAVNVRALVEIAARLRYRGDNYLAERLTSLTVASGFRSGDVAGESLSRAYAAWRPEILSTKSGPRLDALRRD